MLNNTAETIRPPFPLGYQVVRWPSSISSTTVSTAQERLEAPDSAIAARGGRRRLLAERRHRDWRCRHGRSAELSNPVDE
jgi:hypothetical protein